MQQIIVQDFAIAVIRKRIKNIYLRINAATKAIQLSVPLKISEATIREFVTSKIAWINKCLNNKRPVAVALSFESGEWHYFQNEKYQLNIITGQRSNRVVFSPPSINLYLREKGDVAYRSAVLDKWYRQQLIASAEKLFAIWQPIMNLSINELKIRKMKTRWGSCHPVKRQICLNLELAKKPIECLQYVIVHELTHLFERGHNRRFYAYMDRFLPDWRACKKRLNQAEGQEMGC